MAFAHDSGPNAIRNDSRLHAELRCEIHVFDVGMPAFTFQKSVVDVSQMAVPFGENGGEDPTISHGRACGFCN